MPCHCPVTATVRSSFPATGISLVKENQFKPGDGAPLLLNLNVSWCVPVSCFTGMRIVV